VFISVDPWLNFLNRIIYSRTVIFKFYIQKKDPESNNNIQNPGSFVVINYKITCEML